MRSRTLLGRLIVRSIKMVLTRCKERLHQANHGRQITIDSGTVEDANKADVPTSVSLLVGRSVASSQ